MKIKKNREKQGKNRKKKNGTFWKNDFLDICNKNVIILFLKESWKEIQSACINAFREKNVKKTEKNTKNGNLVNLRE